MVYDIAKEYTPYPAGRFKKHGPGSGEGFREKLVEMLNSGTQTIRLVMDHTYGYGSSFLEEAFGGLVRVEKITPEKIWQRIEIDTQDATLRQEIQDYVRDAAKRSAV